MADQDHWQFAAHDAVGRHVFCPKFFPALVDVRQFVMGVEIGFSQSRKVFGGADHISRFQSSEKFASIENRLLRIGGNGARAHDGARDFIREVDYRSKVGVETDYPAGVADQLAVLAEELAVAAGEDFARRRRGRDDVFQAIDAAAFHVNARKHRRRNPGSAILQKLIGLVGTGDVARKENDSGRLQAREQGAEMRGDFSGLESEDEELADLVMKVGGFGLSRHGVKVRLFYTPRICRRVDVVPCRAMAASIGPLSHRNSRGGCLYLSRLVDLFF